MKDVEVIVRQRFKAIVNIAELVLTLLISGFLLKFILRRIPVMCLMVVPTKVSIFDLVAIGLLSVFSVLTSLYFLFNEIYDEKLKRLFLNQRLTNLILSLLGLFYLINWFDKFCIGYRIWVTIYSFIAIPCCLALPFVFIFIRYIIQNSFKQEKKIFQNVKMHISKFWKTVSDIVYDIVLLIVVLLFYYTLPIFYSYTTYGCGLGLVSNVHYSTIIFLILISVISIISFIKPIITKKKAIFEILTTSFLRLLTIVLSLVGRKYFISYQQGNCLIIAQEVWNIIISITWVIGMTLVMFLVIYLINSGRNYLKRSKK